jgi:hypothetical protein
VFEAVPACTFVAMLMVKEAWCFEVCGPHSAGANTETTTPHSDSNDNIVLLTTHAMLLTGSDKDLIIVLGVGAFSIVYGVLEAVT